MRITKASPAAVLAVLVFFIPTAFGRYQQTPILSPSATRIRDQIQALPPDAHLTVIMKNKNEYHGNLESSDADSFTVYEVDQKRSVTVKYEEVKKIRQGYGGYNSVTRRHVDPLRSKVALLAVLGGLVAVLAAVAVAAK